MLTSLRWLVIPALLGLLGFVSPALATSKADKQPFTVKDGGDFFSKEAVDKANRKIAQIKRDFGKDLVIETIDKVSDSATEKVKDEEGRRKYFLNYAETRYDDLGMKGVYVLFQVAAVGRGLQRQGDQQEGVHGVGTQGRPRAGHLALQEEGVRRGSARPGR